MLLKLKQQCVLQPQLSNNAIFIKLQNNNKEITEFFSAFSTGAKF